MSVQRFAFIDGLRGVAALAVVFYHLAAVLNPAAEAGWNPFMLEWVISRGYLGVDIFFVLSGFVIAYSTRNAVGTFGYLGKFALRRSIRLDPPYWITICAEIAVVALTITLFSDYDATLPSVAQAASHLFYAQNLLGYGDILPIFWTLCYEIQFYLAFVLLMVLWRKSKLSTPVVPVVVLSALFLASTIIRLTPAEFPIDGVAVDRWFQFFLGVMAWWIIAGFLSGRVLIAAWSVIALLVMLFGNGIEQFVAVGTSGLIVLAGRRNAMGTWLADRPLQFLGKISYSLYLVHLIVGWRFIALADRLLPPLRPLEAWALYCAGILLSIASAAVLWRIVERPTIMYSKRVSLSPVTDEARPVLPELQMTH